MSEVKRIIIKNTDNYNENKLNYYHLPVIKSVNQLLTMINFNSEDERKFLYSRNRNFFYIMNLSYLKEMVMAREK